MADAAHTPTPWAQFNQYIIPDCEGECSAVARIDVTGVELIDEANAQFIALACNAHDDLVKALEGVIRVADRKTVEFDAARAALAKARGIQP
ncbi:MAG: hypothetical protein JWO78_172 [Micavibrio sp.]|nr:hypothetical protein [Micavibrio sp.]